MPSFVLSGGGPLSPILQSQPLYKFEPIDGFTIPIYINEPIFSKSTAGRKLKVQFLMACMAHSFDPAAMNDLDNLQSQFTESDVATFSSPAVWADYGVYWRSANQILTLCIQLKQDLNLTNHKYIAHQLALLYQCVATCGIPLVIPFKKVIEEKFADIKKVSSESAAPQLNASVKAWIDRLSTDIQSALLTLPAHSSSAAVEMVAGFLAS